MIDDKLIFAAHKGLAPYRQLYVSWDDVEAILIAYEKEKSRNPLTSDQKRGII